MSSLHDKIKNQMPYTITPDLKSYHHKHQHFKILICWNPSWYVLNAFLLETYLYTSILFQNYFFLKSNPW